RRCSRRRRRGRGVQGGLGRSRTDEAAFGGCSPQSNGPPTCGMSTTLPALIPKTLDFPARSEFLVVTGGDVVDRLGILDEVRRPLQENGTLSPTRRVFHGPTKGRRAFSARTIARRWKN